MGNRLKDWLSKGKVTDDPTDTKKLIAIQGEASQTDQSELDRIQSYPFKHEIIHDETNELILEDKVARIVYKPKTDENGVLVYKQIKDPNSNSMVILRDGQNNPVPEYVAHIQIDDHYASVLNALSSRVMLSFLSKGSVDLYNLYLEDIIDTIEMSIPEEDLDLGTGNYLTSLKLQGYISSHDAINGNKVKALLEHRKTTKFEFENQKKKGFF